MNISRLGACLDGVSLGVLSHMCGFCPPKMIFDLRTTLRAWPVLKAVPGVRTVWRLSANLGHPGTDYTQ